MATTNSGNCDSSSNYPNVTGCDPTCVPVSYFPQNASLTSCFNGQALPQALSDISTNSILWTPTGVATCLPTSINNLTGWLTWVEENVVQSFCQGNFVTCASVITALESNNGQCVPDGNPINIFGYNGTGNVVKLPTGTLGDWLRIRPGTGEIVWDTITCNYIKGVLENNGTSCIENGAPVNLIGFNGNGILESLPPGNDGTYLCLLNGVPTWSSLAANVNIDCATLLDLLQPVQQGGNCIQQITGSHPIILGYNPVSGTVQWGDAYNLPDPTDGNQVFYSTGGGAEQTNSNWTASPQNDGEVLTYDLASNSLIWQNPNPTCAEIVNILETGNCIPVGGVTNLIGFNTNGQLMQLAPANIGDILMINQFGQPQYLTLTCTEIIQRLQDGQCVPAGDPVSLIGIDGTGNWETLPANNINDVLTIVNGIPTWQQLTCDMVRNAIQAQPSCVPQTNLATALYVVDENNNWDALGLGNVGEVLTITGAGIEWQPSVATIDCAAVLTALDQNCLTLTNAATGLWVIEADGTNHRLNAATVGDVLRVQANGTLAFETLTCQIIRSLIENNGATCLENTTTANSVVVFDDQQNLDRLTAGNTNQILATTAANTIGWIDLATLFDCQTIRDFLEDGCLEITNVSASLLVYDIAGDLDIMNAGTLNQVLTSTGNGIEWQDVPDPTCAQVVAALDQGCLVDTANPQNFVTTEADGTIHTYPAGNQDEFISVNAAGDIVWRTLTCAEVLAALENGGVTCVPQINDPSIVADLFTIDNNGNITRITDCTWLNHALRLSTDANEAGCVPPQTDNTIEPVRVLGINPNTGIAEYYCLEVRQQYGRATFTPVAQNTTNGQRVPIPVDAANAILIDTFNDGAAWANNGFCSPNGGTYNVHIAPNANIVAPVVAGGVISVVSAIVVTDATFNPLAEFRVGEVSYPLDNAPPAGFNVTLSGSHTLTLNPGQCFIVRLNWSSVTAATAGINVDINASGLAQTHVTVNRIDSGLRIVGGNC